MIDKYSFLFTTGEQYFGWRGTRSPSFQLGCSWYARCCSKPVYSPQELTTPVLDGGELFQWNTLCIRRKSRQALGPDNRFKQETRKKNENQMDKSKKMKIWKKSLHPQKKIHHIVQQCWFCVHHHALFGIVWPSFAVEFFRQNFWPIFGQAHKFGPK